MNREKYELLRSGAAGYDVFALSVKGKTEIRGKLNYAHWPLIKIINRIYIFYVLCVMPRLLINPLLLLRAAKDYEPDEN